MAWRRGSSFSTKPALCHPVYGLQDCSIPTSPSWTYRVCLPSYPGPGSCTGDRFGVYPMALEMETSRVLMVVTSHRTLASVTAVEFPSTSTWAVPYDAPSRQRLAPAL